MRWGIRVVLRTKAKLRLATEAHMTKLQTQPERMRAFFDDSRVGYAARWAIHAGSIGSRLRRNDTACSFTAAILCNLCLIIDLKV